MHPWHRLSVSLSSLLSTRSPAPPPVLSQLWGAVTPPCQAAPAAVFPPWVRVTSEASIQILARSGTMPWSLFPVTCGPLLTSTWPLPTCTSTMADQILTPWTRSAHSTTAALPHTRTRTPTRTHTLTPIPVWTATPTGCRHTTTHPLTALITSPIAGLSLQPCRLNPTWERVASPRRSCSLSPSLCPAGSSTPLTATGRTRRSMPGSSASARNTKRRSDEESPAIFQLELSSYVFFPLSSSLHLHRVKVAVTERVWHEAVCSVDPSRSVF